MIVSAAALLSAAQPATSLPVPTDPRRQLSDERYCAWLKSEAIEPERLDPQTMLRGSVDCDARLLLLEITSDRTDVTEEKFGRVLPAFRDRFCSAPSAEIEEFERRGFAIRLVLVLTAQATRSEFDLECGKSR